MIVFVFGGGFSSPRYVHNKFGYYCIFWRPASAENYSSHHGKSASSPKCPYLFFWMTKIFAPHIKMILYYISKVMGASHSNNNIDSVWFDFSLLGCLLVLLSQYQSAGFFVKLHFYGVWARANRLSKTKKRKRTLVSKWQMIWGPISRKNM